jgi:methyl-accepting chemotaxis protein
MRELPLRKSVPAAVIGLVLISGGALVESTLFSEYQLERSVAMMRQEQAADETSRELIRLQKGIELDIVSTQESLTDMSATRGLDGLDDGVALAAESAKALKDKVQRVNDISGPLNVPELKTALDELSKRFDTFYAKGQEMTAAYVKDGPEAGNKLMPTFDGISDELQAQIEETHKIFDGIVANMAAKAASEADSLEQQSLSNRNVMLGVCGLLFALGIAIAWFVNRRLVSPVVKMTNLMTDMSGGNLDTATPDTHRRDEIGSMARALETFRQSGLENRELNARIETQRQQAEQERAERERLRQSEADSLKEVVDRLGAGLGRLAECNIRMTIDEPFSQDFEALRRDFNNSIGTFQETLELVLEKTRYVEDSSNQLRDASDELAKRAVQQAAALEQTSAAISQINVTVKTSSEKTVETRNLAKTAKKQTAQSSDIVRNAVVAMERIEAASSEIGTIISVVDQIAFQTNLLALNAGVEAARAGDAGKGFAVVAQEVRDLAQRSAQAAQQIKDLVVKSAQEVAEGVRLVGQTGEALQKIDAITSEIDLKAEEVSVASKEQSIGLQEITSAIHELDTMTQRNSAMAEETNALSTSLAGEAENLTGLIARFKLNRRKAIRDTNAPTETLSYGRVA